MNKLLAFLDKTTLRLNDYLKNYFNGYCQRFFISITPIGEQQQQEHKQNNVFSDNPCAQMQKT